MRGVPATRADMMTTLREDAWFAALPADLAEGIVRQGVVRRWRDGEVIFATGDPADGIYAVLGGAVRMLHVTSEGHSAIYYFVQAPSWFGELSELDGGPRVQDAIAVGEVRLLHLARRGFRQLVEREPRHWQHFAALMARHARDLLANFVVLTTRPAPARMARHLAALHRNAERVPWSGSRPALTQDALAAMTGISRQTASRILKQWEREGVVSLSYRAIAIRDYQALARIADHEEPAPERAPPPHGPKGRPARHPARRSALGAASGPR